MSCNCSLRKGKIDDLEFAVGKDTAWHVFHGKRRDLTETACGQVAFKYDSYV